MSRFDALLRLRPWVVVCGLVLATQVMAQQPSPKGQALNATALPGIGRTATPQEIRAWDIDVRPDFKGLPKGQGSVSQGEVVWESKCASCHGTFGESSDVFTPIAGGVRAEDLKTGRVDSLMPGSNQPSRTTVMKLSTLSTLWDYINRAMPWNAPKTLTTDEVYAVTAYILNLGNILPADFTLSDRNIRDVQARLPNRNGMTTAHALWPGKELGGSTRPDVQGSACMRDCKAEVVVKSFMPDYARDSHGNLAEQSRTIGPTRGADTTRPGAGASVAAASGSGGEGKAVTVAAQNAPSAPDALMRKGACLACHGMDSRVVGPSFKEVAVRYKDRSDAVNYLSGKIRTGGQGVWGAIPMPAQSLSPAEADQLAVWLMSREAK
ncbi:c-type cytochrome [Polaromonas sp. YR568]|uniref:c-type cytochrome n=1 Tax=Polaromonas sp. YR568 TaxID=1855301 RepID=UPI0031377CA7